MTSNQLVPTQASPFVFPTTLGQFHEAGGSERLGSLARIEDIPSVFDIHMPSIQYAVEGLIARNAVTLIAADSGGGKSTLTTAIGGAVANGTPFAGLVTNKSPVLYLDRENCGPVVKERLERLNVMDGNGFYYYGGWLGSEAPDLDSPRYIEFVDRCLVKPVIIVDSLLAFHTGEENSASDTRKYMDSARRLANCGAAVVFLHHTGKGENARQFRGSSDIKAAVDVAYSLEGDNAGRLSRLTLKNFKARFTTMEILALQYDDGRFNLLSQHGACVLSPHHDALTRLICEKPGLLAGQIEQGAAKFNIPRKEAREFLRIGESTGSLEVKPSGPRGKGYYLASSSLEVRR